MVVGKFNYHKILFTLDTFANSEEKISHLYSVKLEVSKIIQCFSESKFQPLRNYARENKFADDGWTPSAAPFYECRLAWVSWFL